jgi:hypothetical protein
LNPLPGIALQHCSEGGRRKRASPSLSNEAYAKEIEMTLFDRVNDVLKKHSSESGTDAVNASQQFDQVAQAAPQGALAEGLSSAFRSNQTPAFGSLIGNLFTQSNAEQKAGVLNHLIASLGPGYLSRIPGGDMITNLLAGGKQITPDQAQNVSPGVVEKMATHAEKADPSIVERASAFYAQHPTLVKTLGGAALSIIMAKVAERQRAA